MGGPRWHGDSPTCFPFKAQGQPLALQVVTIVCCFPSSPVLTSETVCLEWHLPPARKHHHQNEGTLSVTTCNGRATPSPKLVPAPFLHSAAEAVWPHPLYSLRAEATEQADAMETGGGGRSVKFMTRCCPSHTCHPVVCPEVSATTEMRSGMDRGLLTSTLPSPAHLPALLISQVGSIHNHLQESGAQRGQSSLLPVSLFKHWRPGS